MRCGMVHSLAETTQQMECQHTQGFILAAAAVAAAPAQQGMKSDLFEDVYRLIQQSWLLHAGSLDSL